MFISFKVLGNSLLPLSQQRPGDDVDVDPRKEVLQRCLYAYLSCVPWCSVDELRPLLVSVFFSSVIRIATCGGDLSFSPLGARFECMALPVDMKL